MHTLRSPFMISPNDLVLVDENMFYFTNDHRYTKGVMRLLEDYAGLAKSNVVYFDGNKYKVVAGNIAYANGVVADVKNNLLFVASSRKFCLKIYHRNADGSLQFKNELDCGTGVDNIEQDEHGDLWIGCHPNLLRFTAYATGKKSTAPSEIIKISQNEGEEILAWSKF